MFTDEQLEAYWANNPDALVEAADKNPSAFGLTDAISFSDLSEIDQRYDGLLSDKQQEAANLRGAEGERAYVTAPVELGNERMEEIANEIGYENLRGPTGFLNTGEDYIINLNSDGDIIEDRTTPGSYMFKVSGDDSTIGRYDQQPEFIQQVSNLSNNDQFVNATGSLLEDLSPLLYANMLYGAAANFGLVPGLSTVLGKAGAASLPTSMQVPSILGGAAADAAPSVLPGVISGAVAGAPDITTQDGKPPEIVWQDTSVSDTPGDIQLQVPVFEENVIQAPAERAQVASGDGGLEQSTSNTDVVYLPEDPVEREEVEIVGTTPVYFPGEGEDDGDFSVDTLPIPSEIGEEQDEGVDFGPLPGLPPIGGGGGGGRGGNGGGGNVVRLESDLALDNEIENLFPYTKLTPYQKRALRPHIDYIRRIKRA